MRAEIARADRYAAVRNAAEGWRTAGAIDEATHRAVIAAYPDDRVRLSLGLRILAGAATFVGGVALVVLVGSVFGFNEAGTVLSLVFTALFATTTELQVGRLRRAQAGAEYATALLAAICAGFAAISLVELTTRGPSILALALVLAVAAWRWGYASLAVLAAVLLLEACSAVSAGRAIWLAMGLAAFPMILLAARSPRWPPAHRRCWRDAGLVFLVGAYLAASNGSLDHTWMDGFFIGVFRPPGTWARGAAIAGTILVPPIVFGLGVRFRERALLAAGALFIAASLVTLRLYYAIAPLWLALLAGGCACLGLAVALRRWLDRGAGHERRGVTADPLFSDRRLLAGAQAVATIVALSPGARVAPEEGFQGGGGRSGGGGAAGTT